jgi:D-amino peptidase
MKIYVICDLEGTAGVVDHRLQCRFSGDFYREAREQATRELNALVEGLADAGATEIVAWDGHAGFPGGINPFSVHEKCRIITGAGNAGPVLLDRSFGAACLLGLHAMAGAKKAVLAHSFMPFFDEIVLNGVRIGEIGMNCLTAGQYDVPVIFVSGDQAAADEASALVAGITCAVVKYGLSETAVDLSQQSPALSLSPAEACNVIRDKAKAAIDRINEIQPTRVTPPYTLTVTYKERQYAEDFMKNNANARRISDLTVQMTEDDLFKLRF